MGGLGQIKKIARSGRGKTKRRGGLQRKIGLCGVPAKQNYTTHQRG